MAKMLKDNDLLILCLSGKSQTDIAKSLGMTKSQICRRINTPEFQKLLSEYRKKLLDGVMTDLTANIQKATKTLVELLDDKSPFVRFQAASKIIAITQDFYLQHDLQQEIADLKKQITKEYNTTGGV